MKKGLLLGLILLEISVFRSFHLTVELTTFSGDVGYDNFEQSARIKYLVTYWSSSGLHFKFLLQIHSNPIQGMRVPLILFFIFLEHLV